MGDNADVSVARDPLSGRVVHVKDNVTDPLPIAAFLALRKAEDELSEPCWMAKSGPSETMSDDDTDTGAMIIEKTTKDELTDMNEGTEDEELVTFLESLDQGSIRDDEEHDNHVDDMISDDITMQHTENSFAASSLEESKHDIHSDPGEFIVKPCYPLDDPLGRKKWSVDIRKRSYAYHMPREKVHGRCIILWLENVFRLRDNWALTHALWMSEQLQLSLTVMSTVSEELPLYGRLHRVKSYQSASSAEMLQQWNVPWILLSVGDTTSAISIVSRYVEEMQAHCVIADECYDIDSISVRRGVGSQIKAALFAIDCSNSKPLRYMPTISSLTAMHDEIIESLKSALALQWNHPKKEELPSLTLQRPVLQSGATPSVTLPYIPPTLVPHFVEPDSLPTKEESDDTAGGAVYCVNWSEQRGLSQLAQLTEEVQRNSHSTSISSFHLHLLAPFVWKGTLSPLFILQSMVIACGEDLNGELLRQVMEICFWKREYVEYLSLKYVTFPSLQLLPAWVQQDFKTTGMAPRKFLLSRDQLLQVTYQSPVPGWNELRRLLFFGAFLSDDALRFLFQHVRLWTQDGEEAFLFCRLLLSLSPCWGDLSSVAAYWVLMHGFGLGNDSAEKEEALPIVGRLRLVDGAGIQGELEFWRKQLN